MEQNPKYVNILKMVGLLALLVSVSINAQDSEQSIININNITSWISNDGSHPWVVGEKSLAGDMWNGTFPKGTAGAIITENILWGGKVLDGGNVLVRASGGFFSTGNVPLTRIFRVRTDYYNTDLTDDAATYFQIPKDQLTEDKIKELYNQYEKDWNEWPADKGAPYFDIDKDGRYDPDVDVPGVPGALQTIWINYNDFNSDSLFGSPPIGLNISETYWAYGYSGVLAKVIYRKVNIIYEGTSNSILNSKLDSMYITLFAYCSLGDYRNDFVGCDTILNLGYLYNSSNTDTVYNRYFQSPPSVGYTFLQGNAIRTGNVSDSAIVNFKWRHGYKFSNFKPLNRFIYEAVGGSWAYPFPRYEGTLELYNIMRGYRPIPWYPRSYKYPLSVTDYTSNGVYTLTGDPVTGTGKIDGIDDGPGIRGMFLTNGPFSLTLGDTVEVVIALVGGMGEDHLSSITELKKNTRAATLFYNYFVEEMTSGTIQVTPPDRPRPNFIPDYYVLYQNFPNPFNSTTTIKYDLPEPALVTLIVYDILGREVSRLVDKQQEAGKYNVKFNADNLSSGVYFYKITFNNSSSKLVFDNLYKTMKLILVK